jgi:hypothetical protein
MNMNRLSLILAMALVSAGAYAQGTGGDVTMSTDPAKAAAVEKHAQELQAHQSEKAAQSKPTSAHAGTTHKAKGKTSTTHGSAKHKTGTAHKS